MSNRQMKKSVIVFIELGMVGGIVLALFMVPPSTPLPTFLLASAACFAVGNFLLFRKIKQMGAGGIASKGSPYPHLLRAFATLAATWILVWLLHRT
jgi:hypothetical protein